ncbi:hypothetical protein [Oceanobacillus bengalensis]|uniref:Uncharacterized protein n=1 Tax=Oceanobacillus bengalensis TaxID=1435466 RepID=A0A494YRD0_9BACI|nr:hypothetical protein [Oceanobacillus bengalensis]RKQ11834.1 hypothetical protein D8M05_19210 [Oceanobacillus bengalensis]
MNIDLYSISNQMPEFSNHQQARDWFKSQFEDNFLLRSSDEMSGKKIYYYHIVKDPDTYKNYMESFSKPEKHEITNMETFESYSTVEISERGDVTILI